MVSIGILKVVKLDLDRLAVGEHKHFRYKHLGDTTYKGWIKAHICIGVKTNIITSIEITDNKCADSPQMIPLLEDTAETFTIGDVTADKAYLGRDNCSKIAELGRTDVNDLRNEYVCLQDRIRAQQERGYSRDKVLAQSLQLHRGQLWCVEKKLKELVEKVKAKKIY
jgi:hypothetical protein